MIGFRDRGMIKCIQEKEDRRMEKRSMLLSVMAVLVLFAVYTHAAAQPMDIKITTVQLKQQQMGVGIERLSKYIQEKLKDKVRVRTYPAAQLYSGQEEIQAVIKGEIQMAFVIGSTLELLDASQELLKLPFFFPSIDVTYRYLEGPVGKKLFAKIDQKGVELLGIVSSGDVAISNNRRLIKVTEDCKGLKMRSYGRMGAATLQALGAMAIVTPSEETYTALQQGVIDGMTTPANVFLARKYYEVQKYVTNGGMLNATFAFILGNKAWWQKLPADVRTGLSEALQRNVKEMRADVEVENKKIFEQIAAKGCQLYALTAQDQAVWKKTLQPVYTEFTPIVGTELVKESQQEIERLSKTK
jgi:C4-dicarboxylate-binding protein DctP